MYRMQPNNISSGVYSPVLRQLVIIIGILTIIGLGTWLFMQPILDVPLAAKNTELLSLKTEDELKPCLLDRPGYIKTKLYGSLNMTLNFHGDQLQCSGKLNAINGRSRIAMVVEQALADSRTSKLVFVIGIENVEENTTQKGLDTNLTIVDQSNGLFFGTQGIGRCWTDLQQLLIESEAKQARYRAEGEVYCAGAIAQIKGPGFITISNFSFAAELLRSIEKPINNKNGLAE
jgi:hypothetical protein